MDFSRNGKELETVFQQMHKLTMPEPGVAKLMRELSSSPAVLQMQKMQEDIAAMVKEREFLFPVFRATPEITDVFQEMRSNLAKVAPFVNALNEDAQRAYAAIDAQMKEVAQFRIPDYFSGLKFPEFPKIDWEAVTKKQREGVTALAKKGWTIAAWMPLPDISRLGDSSQEEIEDYFLAHYLGRDGEKGELQETSAELLASARMDKWKGLLEEIFVCIDLEKYRICIPSLLSILEGFTMESLYKENNVNRSSTRVRSAVEGAKWHEQDDFIGIMWMSVVTFFKQLFANSNFDSAAPTFINRHWVLHGRSATDWTASDAFRLLNALATLHWYFSD
jgi:hypothetical protein